jgi:uncharacterized membrane protein
MRRFLPWLVVWAVACFLAVVTSVRSIERYHEFASGWPWDLAYNNQWFWAMLYGDSNLSIRPINFWGDEGPWIWTRTHLDPIRVLCVPIYAMFPDPRTLLVIQNVMLWWVVPAAFGLARSESGSDKVGLLAASLVPLTPLLWPLAMNDYREMELGLPFVLWAIQGYRERRLGLAALGIFGALLCREEFGLFVASLAILPSKSAEDIGTTYRWARGVFTLGIGWIFFAFFGHQTLFVAHNAPELWLSHFSGPKLPLLMSLESAFLLLTVGLGSWVLLALFAPRVALLVLPWLIGLCRGRWDLRHLSSITWGNVRYTTPIVGILLAAGVIGFARAAQWCLARRWGRGLLAGLWVAIAVGLLATRVEIDRWLARAPRPISRADVAAAWTWIQRVGPEDGVLAPYSICAPLSSRRLLYSYTMAVNEPRGYPHLAPEITWVFLEPHRLDPALLAAQGFEVVYDGETLRIYHRERSR